MMKFSYCLAVFVCIVVIYATTLEAANVPFAEEKEDSPLALAEENENLMVCTARGYSP